MPTAPASRRLLVRSAAIALGIGLAGSLPVAAATHTVAALNYRFGPASLTVGVGDTVRWTFAGEPHSVTSGTPPLPDGKFDSGIIGIDEPRPTFAVDVHDAGDIPVLLRSPLRADGRHDRGQRAGDPAADPEPHAEADLEADRQPDPEPHAEARADSKPTASPTPSPTPTAAPTSGATASTSASASSPSPSPAATDPPAGGPGEAGPSVALPALGLLVLVVGGAIALARRRGA